jgi:hypothetical protein
MGSCSSRRPVAELPPGWLPPAPLTLTFILDDYGHAQRWLYNADSFEKFYERHREEGAVDASAHGGGGTHVTAAGFRILCVDGMK